MAKPTGPLLSLGASGTIADTITYSRWRGIPYVRQRVIPANPQTAAQTLTRNVFKWSSDLWKNAPTLLRSPWDTFAAGQPLTGRNAFIGSQTRLLRTETDILLWQGSPGAKGGIALASIAITPGVGDLTVDVTEPTLPTGWTIVQAVFALLPAQNPQVDAAVIEAVTFDAATPFQAVFAGLDNTVLYTCSAWLEWLKPDGATAYGASINDSNTPT